MDKQTKILINSSKNVNSVNNDSYDRIEISGSKSEINEYDVRNVINTQEVFEIERNANPIYRIYGKIEYLSLLNGLTNDYSQLGDFFNPQSGDSKTLLNSFDLYLVKPSTGFTAVTNTNDYIRTFEVVATPDNIEIADAGFSNNVYDEQTYTFHVNIDIDLTYDRDDLNFPITTLYLYAQYKNSSNPTETYKARYWTESGSSFNNVDFTSFYDFNVGELLRISSPENYKISDLIEYDRGQFTQSGVSDQKFNILTPYTGDTGTTRELVWEYNPLTRLDLRYFSSNLDYVNSGGTSYDLIQSIPDYATNYPIGTENLVWRDVTPEGYTDPINNEGNDLPFVNKRRYFFENIVLDIAPDLTDANTEEVFREVAFARSAVTDTFLPISDINKINSPCQ